MHKQRKAYIHYDYTVLTQCTSASTDGQIDRRTDDWCFIIIATDCIIGEV